tara:strand:+ start:238 stop:402 length:165 start_codon:yes stop_codon:yes gene_type:complete
MDRDNEFLRLSLLSMLQMLMLLLSMPPMAMLLPPMMLMLILIARDREYEKLTNG